MKSARGARPTVLTAPGRRRKVLSGSELRRIHIADILSASVNRSGRPSVQSDMASFLFDLRDAFHGLRRDRAYALTVVCTLALTIGGTTAVFSIVDGVLLRPLAYRESHRLVSLKEIWRQLAERIPTLAANEQHFEYWRTHAQTFESM